MPVGPMRKPVTADQTAVISPEQRFDIGHSAPSKTHAAPRPALDFSQIRNIDRFELIREIARGGMGQVFLARDTKLGRKVAIKFLLHDDPDFVQRFLVEARATARCTHENIVTIYEVGEHAGLPYMVLEYLEGKTLSDVLDSSPSIKYFAELMVPVARALERAHEHGIVHRDLKPSNIFVTDRGQVKVLDFGVARMIDRAGAPAELVSAGEARAMRFSEKSSSVTFTGDDSLVGTLPYMSPEQWGAGVVDHQSDIWAVGIMFWRALTNVHPAGTTAPDKLRARLLDLAIPLPSIGERDASIPPALAAVIDRCVRKRKDERYQSASDLLADLQAFLSPTARASEDTCPYRGLAAFGEEDAKYFFGRGNEVRTARSQLEAWPLLAVIGPSGVGK
jgi:serine/threonine protein kinase